ncbi:mechanosensitive ion channel family protein [Arthrospira platensis]|uniref:MscS mechanosensitive ion channel family protein n=1 Tax=Limnospira platensis NIES-46 TaxID=1236695 RepID=A0A5M3TCL8_LIMPL|nr:mechanosensitive ion channel domain-containing protein [Arthrospira platensis]AMW28962.1 mechanosensitive ion channel protein MscS [Arthrospira platensis YZ]MDF2212759.1 mechanosensitive ion channel [Arthrospira platensis NCB002]MDT9185211.1 mechanosensitive ion channel [Limnospira sp. PMC 289.06]MDT9312892.1 mechanosensitive ion channel [Limnospira sp. Paracas R14]QQW32059.2 mechanosensitive ion channel [Arthrospira sp. PCC 9108]BAI91059.1 MscS mechanosensitive ion channel family protein 
MKTRWRILPLEAIACLDKSLGLTINYKILRKITYFVSVLVLTFSLTVAGHSPAFGQFFVSPVSITDQQNQTFLWNVNRAYSCGASWCSRVYLGGHGGRGGLILGARRSLEQDDRATALTLERRAKLVQESFNRGLRNIISRNQELPQTYHPENWQFWRLFNPDKPLHPLTPQLNIGIQNNETVIYTQPNHDLRIPQIVVITVNNHDAIVNGITVEELAPVWRDQITQYASEALWGREFDAQYPLGRITITLIIVAFIFLCLRLISGLRKLLTQRRNLIKSQLQNLVNEAKVNPETLSGETLSDTVVQPNEDISDDADKVKNVNSNGQGYSSGYLHQKINQKINQIPKLIARRLNSQVSLQQGKNLVELLRRFLLIAELLVILLGISLICFVFRQTRPLIIMFAYQAILLPSLWVGITLIDKLLDFFIDDTLNGWAQEQQESHPNLNRYTMRVSTYSPALKGGKSWLFSGLGIYFTVVIIGINTAFLAGAGAFALLTAFLSRNLIENMLNGILILLTDRYAVGDVVQIGNLAGAVESMNLYCTNLRNLDGQLITIPHGQVATVINNTKDWSRVNLGLKIAWDADIRKAMEIILKVCQKMQNEAEWSDKILEPVDILGVDDISHEGIVIRFLVKTIPSQQWAAARTLRFRLKQALDEAEITLGVPQRFVWYHQHDHQTSRDFKNLLKP